jgi:hypothetical protein
MRETSDTDKFRGMLKKAVREGRSERRGEEVHTGLCVSRSPLQMILGERINSSITCCLYSLVPAIEPVSDARTKPTGFFSIRQGGAR